MPTRVGRRALTPRADLASERVDLVTVVLSDQAARGATWAPEDLAHIEAWTQREPRPLLALSSALQRAPGNLLPPLPRPPYIENIVFICP